MTSPWWPSSPCILLMIFQPHRPFPTSEMPQFCACLGLFTGSFSSLWYSFLPSHGWLLLSLRATLMLSFHFQDHALPLSLTAPLFIVLWTPRLLLVSHCPEWCLSPVGGCRSHCHTLEWIVEEALPAFSRCLGGASHYLGPTPFLPSPSISSTRTPWWTSSSVWPARCGFWMSVSGVLQSKD